MNLHPTIEDFPPADATRGMSPGEHRTFDAGYRLGFITCGLKREGRWSQSGEPYQPPPAYQMGDMSNEAKLNLELGLIIGSIIGFAAGALVIGMAWLLA